MNRPIESDGVPGFLHSNETLLISEEGEIKNTLNASREPTERPLGPPLPLQHRLPSQAGIPGLPRCARHLQPSVPVLTGRRSKSVETTRVVYQREAADKCDRLPLIFILWLAESCFFFFF